MEGRGWKAEGGRPRVEGRTPPHRRGVAVGTPTGRLRRFGRGRFANPRGVSASRVGRVSGSRFTGRVVGHPFGRFGLDGSRSGCASGLDGTGAGRHGLLGHGHSWMCGASGLSEEGINGARVVLSVWVCRGVAWRARSLIWDAREGLGGQNKTRAGLACSGWLVWGRFWGQTTAQRPAAASAMSWRAGCSVSGCRRVYSRTISAGVPV